MNSVNANDCSTLVLNIHAFPSPANGIMAPHGLFAKTGTPDTIVKLVDRDHVGQMI